MCDTRCEATTSRLRRDFESQASSGEYTVLRFSRSEWGFYPPLPRELQPPRPEYLDYAELLLKPALRGLEVVEGLLRERSRLAGKPEERRKSARIAARLGANDS